MKNILLLAILGLGLTAQAQYWTTNNVFTTNSEPYVIATDTNGVQSWATNYVFITNKVQVDILVTNNVKCTLAAASEAALKELHATLKDAGEVTGTFNSWFDTVAAQAVSSAMTSKSGELTAKKEERLLNLWRKATVAAQTNAISTLK